MAEYFCPVGGEPVSRPNRMCRMHAQQIRGEREAGSKDEDFLRAYVEEGLTLRQVGGRYGVSHERARYRINRAISRLPELEKRRLYGDR